MIETERLTLRRWCPTDLDPYAKLNADSRVMEYFPEKLTRDQSKEHIELFEKKLTETGIGFLAAELKETQQFIGFIGLNVPSYPLPFSPCVEIGWRLAFEFWGQGFAQEGARAALSHGFQKHDLKEIVSFTTTGNLRSINVMKKIGMSHDPAGDFIHPKIPRDNPMAFCVLYRIGKAQFEGRI